MKEITEQDFTNAGYSVIYSPTVYYKEGSGYTIYISCVALDDETFGLHTRCNIYNVCEIIKSYPVKDFDFADMEEFFSKIWNLF